MQRAHARLLAVAAATIGVALGGVAYAQEAPVPTIPVPPAPTLPVPAPPGELDPVTEATAPLVTAVCQLVGLGPGTLSGATSYTALAFSLGNAYSPVPLPRVGVPVEAYGYLGLAAQPCSALPAPATFSECGVDRDADSALNTVFEQTGAGIGLVFVATPTLRIGPVLDTVVAAERLLADNGVSVPGAPAATVYDALACDDILAGLGSAPDIPLGGGPTAVTGVEPVTAPVAGGSDEARTGRRVATLPVPAVDTPAVDVPGPGEVAAPAVDLVAGNGGETWTWWRILGLALVGLAVAGLYLAETTGVLRDDRAGRSVP